MTTVNVLLIKEEVWSAQCLEHDIVGQGETIDQAMMQLTMLLAAEEIVQLEGGGSLNDIPPAPQWYWEKFNQAVNVSPRLFPVRPSMDVPPAYMLPQLRECRVI